MEKNIDKIVKAIQVIVKEEVSKQLKRVLKEEVSKQVRRAINENTPSLNEAISYNSSNVESYDEWPTMGHNLSTPPLTPRVTMEGMEDIMGVPAGSNININDPAQKSVLKAMNRDYSALMKAINKGK
jgi:hypothetical protein